MNQTYRLCIGLLLILTILTCLASVSCDVSPTSRKEAATDGRPVVGIIACRTTPYWSSVEFGANHSADKNDLHLLWRETAQQDGSDQQASAIQDLIARQVQGVILASQNELMLRETVKQATNRGIHVLLIDSTPLSNTGNKTEFLSVIATDQYRAGQLAADEVARLINKKGRVAVIRYSPLVFKTENREKGFLAQIRSYPDIKVVGHDLFAGTDHRRTKEKITNFLQLYSWNGRSELDGIFISDESMACDTLRLVEQAKYDNKIHFVAFGTDPRLVTGMLTYRVDALFMEQPARMGQQAVDAMAELLRGHPVAPFFDSGVHCVTIDNLSSPYSQALLNPPSENLPEILLDELPKKPNPVDAWENAERQDSE
ncbi:MAG: substrate-binding domain-containing protein [Planctomycetaceae bacterium]|nr:substrate-binding domain-containing protein [Planctomycetaceae bacterium]